MMFPQAVQIKGVCMSRFKLALGPKSYRHAQLPSLTLHSGTFRIVIMRRKMKKKIVAFSGFKNEEFKKKKSC